MCIRDSPPSANSDDVTSLDRRSEHVPADPEPPQCLGAGHAVALRQRLSGVHPSRITHARIGDRHGIHDSCPAASDPHPCRRGHAALGTCPVRRDTRLFDGSSRQSTAHTCPPVRTRAHTCAHVNIRREEDCASGGGVLEIAPPEAQISSRSAEETEPSEAMPGRKSGCRGRKRGCRGEAPGTRKGRGSEDPRPFRLVC